MSNRYLHLCIVALLTPSLPAIASQTPTVLLDPIVVTATRTSELASKTPASVSVISERQIQQNPTHNLESLLRQDAAANVVRSGGVGQISSVFLRGAESDHTLVLKDGVRLNTATTGSANLHFLNTSDVERVEIVKGPASVLYGTDAIGGVVQMLSKTPTQTNASVTALYGENNTRQFIANGGYVDNGFYAQAHAQTLKSDGTPVVGKEAFDKDAAYKQKGFGAKVGYQDDKLHLSADFAQNKGTSEYINRPWGATAYQEVSHDFKNTHLNLKGQFNLNQDWSLNTRLSQFKDSLTQNNSKDFIHSNSKEAEIYTKWQFTPQQNLIFGTTYRKLNADVLSFGTPYQATVNSQGYFAQHQYNDDKVKTQAGVRVEDNAKYGTHTVAQGAVRFHISPTTGVYTNIGSAFRSPNFNEMYGFGGDVNLKPETSVSYEVGADTHITDSIKVGASVYRTDIKNMIDWANGKNTNVNKARLTGSEIFAKWQHDNLFAKLSYNYVKPQNQVSGRDLNRRPRHNGVLTVGFDNGIYGIDTTIQAKSKSQDWLADYMNAGYTTVDVNGYWQATPNTKLFANIENIGDNRYATAYEGSEAGVYYRNGGRQANIGVTFSY